MNERVMKQLKHIIDTIDNNEQVIKFKQNKEQIKKDIKIQELIIEYNNQTNDIERLKIKNELYANALYKEYNSFITNLHYNVLYFNNKMNHFIRSKQCQNPTDVGFDGEEKLS